MMAFTFMEWMREFFFFEEWKKNCRNHHTQEKEEILMEILNVFLM